MKLSDKCTIRTYSALEIDEELNGKMFFVLRRTYRNLFIDHMRLMGEWRDTQDDLARSQANNLSLLARLSAFRKHNKPIKNKAGRWYNPHTGAFCKAPDAIRDA